MRDSHSEDVITTLKKSYTSKKLLENLTKLSGKGILFITNIPDVAKYHDKNKRTLNCVTCDCGFNFHHFYLQHFKNILAQKLYNY